MNIKNDKSGLPEELKFVEADYKPQKIIDYIGNPFIEALPPILEDNEEIADAFYHIPKILPNEKSLPPLLRAHIIRKVKHFIQPLPIQIAMEPKISVLIRQSYLSRNPFAPEYNKKIQLLHQLQAEGEITIDKIDNAFQNFSSTSDCLFINGVSGMGKTTTIKCILNLYQPVIKHSKYQDKLLTKTQIVWLKVDCPHDGSFINLCRSIFQEIDRLTGNRWNEKYGYLTHSPATMIMHLVGLLSTYNVGLLVIDEIQQLHNSNDDPEKMLNFFVTLTNKLSVPIVFIGTNRARKLFQENFRLARRAQSEGYIEIANLKKDSREWELFIETLFEDFNVLENGVSLEDNLKTVFHDECQGVLAVAVMLFMFSQNRAMSEGRTMLSVELIKRTAAEDLKLIAPMLKALRSGDPQQIAKFDDISIDENAILLHYKQNIENKERIQEIIEQKKRKLDETRNNIHNKLLTEIVTSGLFNTINYVTIETIIQTTISKSDANIDYEELKDIILERLQNEKKKLKESKPNGNVVSFGKQSLCKVYDKAIENKQHPYDAFNKQGLIKDPIIEFKIII